MDYNRGSLRRPRIERGSFPRGDGAALSLSAMRIFPDCERQLFVKFPIQTDPRCSRKRAIQDMMVPYLSNLSGPTWGMKPGRE